jgi:hypothetical protein
MRMKAMNLIHTSVRFVLRILEVQLPMAESTGIRIR